MLCYREIVSMHRQCSSIGYRALVVFFLALQAIPLTLSLGQEHFQIQPGQTIDISKLPADVLNCDECRRRLGLPPLAVNSTQSKPQLDATSTKPELSPLASSDTKSKDEPPQKESEAPAKKPSPLEGKKEELNKVESNKIQVKKAELPKDEVAETKPTLKQLGQQASQPASKTATASDWLRIDGVLISPATQRIEIEILKRQLEERDSQLKQLSQMQANVEERIDQLVRMNEDLAKKNTDRQDELNRLQKSSEQTLQARELEISNLRADLATVRAEANEKTKRLHDQLLEMEAKKAKEIAKLNEELIEAKQERIDAVANLRKEFTSNQEATVVETDRIMAEQAKTRESQKTTIRNLEMQLANAEKAQRDDAERIAKLREELNAAFAARTKALEELADRPIPSEPSTTPSAKPSNLSKERPSAPRSTESVPMKSQAAIQSEPAMKVVEPAKASFKPESPGTNALPNASSVESDSTQRRRAF